MAQWAQSNEIMKGERKLVKIGRLLGVTKLSEFF